MPAISGCSVGAAPSAGAAVVARRRAVVAAHLAALHHDLRIGRAREPVLAVFAVDHYGDERLAIDEVVDARAHLLIGLDFEVAAARAHFGAASVDDTRAVAAVLCLQRSAAAEGDDASGEMER
jgi:hypothetical protein